MKKIIFLLLLFIKCTMFAQVEQEFYRWRNDDGNEQNATWIAEINQSTTPIAEGVPLRLRFGLRSMGFPGNFNPNNLQYRKNGEQWIPVTNSTANDFYFINSAHVSHNSFTTQQITWGMFVEGVFISSDENQNPLFFPPNRITEIEYCIARSASYDGYATYEFRMPYAYPMFGGYPTLTPLCATAAPTVTDVNYQYGETPATLTAEGTDLLWYSTASGGIGSTVAPTPNASALGITSYWVSQTLNGCEGPRVKINVSIFTNGQSASGLIFDGVDDYIDCGNAITASLATANKFTIETWVKPNNVTGGKMIFGNHSTEIPGASQASLRIVNNRYEIMLGHGTHSLMTPVGSALANTWQHVAATWDGTNLKIFIDGVLSNSMTISSYVLNNITEKMYFGKNVYNEWFKGMIDETRIWNIALTDAEIQNSYNCEITNQPGLIAYYRFNQGVDGADNTAITTLTDFTGNANNGTLYNFDLNGSSSNWASFDGSPLAPISTNQTFCMTSNSTIADLVVSGNDGGTFNWYNTASSENQLSAATILETGTYYVSKVNGSCENSRFSVNVSVMTAPAITAQPQNQTVTEADDLVFSVEATNGVNYQWEYSANGTEWNELSDDSTEFEVSGAITNTVTISGDNLIDLNGFSFRVVITGNSACNDVVSDTAEATVTLGTDRFGVNILSIYPNPSTGIFNISAQEEVSLTVYDLVGKLIKTQQSNVGTSTIDISNYASGMYLLKATNKAGITATYKIVKQ